MSGRQINLIDDRDDLKTVVERQIQIRQRLRFDPLAGIDNQYRAFTGLQRPADLIAEINVSRRIDQIHLIDFTLAGRVIHTNGRRFDRHAALAFQIHSIEHLLLHFTIRDRASHLQQPIRQCTFAVIDMRNNTEITNV